MLQLLKDPHIDFMKWGRFWMSVSALLMLASLVVVVVKGVRLGIEFTGGTELQLKYAEPPDVAAIRAALDRAGVRNEGVTTIGDPSEHEVYIRLAQREAGGDELPSLVVKTLRGGDPSRVDVNVADEATIRGLLLEAPLGADSPSATELAAEIAAARKESAIFRSADDLAAVPGMGPEALDYLRSHAEFGPLALRSQSFIGPAVGRELLQKTYWVIALSLLVMLLYIGFRFQLQWGFAAVLALIHDTLITLGLFALLEKEMNLGVVAAFLTLIGYSVNDTVVVFDRIRENLRAGGGGSLAGLVNTSINQTLGRTVITSGLTWFSCAALYLFGGPALDGFSFVLTFGIIIGSYSTIFTATPFLVEWKQFLDRRRGAAEAVPASAGKPAARKVRTSSSGGA